MKRGNSRNGITDLVKSRYLIFFCAFEQTEEKLTGRGI